MRVSVVIRREGLDEYLVFKRAPVRDNAPNESELSFLELDLRTEHVVLIA
jgi:hypothetical protein